MNSTLVPQVHQQSPPPRTLPPWLPPLAIIAFALAYYSSYLTFWFNPHDEGGTVCFTSQRLLQGARPWADLELGYNVGWFYPLVALFKFTGVHYLAARAFFFTLSTLTALLGYHIILRLTSSLRLALPIALLLVVFPGSQFKNYIPLAEMANLACLILLLHSHFSHLKKWLLSLSLSAFTLGLTFLVRVEIAIFFSTIYSLLFLFLLLDQRLPLPQRFTRLLLSFLTLASVTFAVHIPPYLALRHLGVAQTFARQIPDWFGFLRHNLSTQTSSTQTPSTPSPTTSSPANPSPANPSPPPHPLSTLNPSAQSISALTLSTPTSPTDRANLRRRPISDIWRPGPLKPRLLATLTYAPILPLTVFFLIGLALLIRQIFQGNFQLLSPPFLLLLCVGSSLTTFPQFFLFRPDGPHLSEFMTGYLVTLAAGLALLWPKSPKWSHPSFLVAIAALAFSVLHISAYAAYALQSPSTGTIAARSHATTLFSAENGVKIHCSKRQALSLSTVRDAILSHSHPGDFLICFPYMPGYNLLTNRPTYLHSVYINNATASSSWATNTIQEFIDHRPPVIVIDNRAVNGTDASRFSHWALPVYEYIQIHYTKVAQVKSPQEFIEVFSLSPSPITPPPIP